MEALEVPESIRKELIVLGNEKSLSLEALDVILDHIFHKALSWKKTDMSGSIKTVLLNLQQENLVEGVNEEELASHFGCLSTLISICVRQNASEEPIRTLLTACKWECDRIDGFVKYYVLTKPKIRTYLKLFGDQTAKLVDVDWRLDLRRKNGEVGLTNDITYIIDFKLDNQGHEEIVQFSASKPELEDLVSVLRDATYALKRLTS